jgi:NAD(P)-dependent dehydrogenase (short-subunit alcohol dehydrogenase family)
MSRALVTGANGGIGRAIVERLRTDGFDVTTMDVTAPADLVCDLATGDVPSEAMGDFEVCVSNAGIVDTLAPAHTMSAAKWDRDLAVNLTGSFRVLQACLPGMRERRYGRIVVMSSLAAKLGAQGQVAYSASKAGLLGMAKTIAAENAGLGITVNCILPGLIGTEKVRAMPEHILERVRVRSNFLATGRLGEPAEVAQLVAYLVSPEAGYVTGQEIAIDGGGGLSPFSLGAKE